MSGYISVIRGSVLLFPFVAAILSIPYMIHEYHRVGAVSISRAFAVFAFILYLMSAFFLVIMPLPSSRDAYYSYAATPQLVPFKQLHGLVVLWHEAGARLSEPKSWIPVLRDFGAYSVVFNLVLFMPLGAYERWFRHRSFLLSVILGFLLSLFFEITQLTGLYGIYEHPYRLFDVDDLIVNTCGAALGWILAWPLCVILPDPQDMDEASRELSANYTTFTRRAVSFVLDIVCTLLMCAMLFELGGGDLLAGSLLPLVSSRRGELLWLVTLVSVFIWVIIPTLTGGKTPGQVLVAVRMVRPDGSRARFSAYLERYIVLELIELLVPVWLYVMYPTSAVDAAGIDTMRQLVVMWYGLFAFIIAARALASAFRHPFVLMAELISDTRIMSDTHLRSLHQNPLSGQVQRQRNTPRATPRASRSYRATKRVALSSTAFLTPERKNRLPLAYLGQWRKEVHYGGTP